VLVEAIVTLPNLNQEYVPSTPLDDDPASRLPSNSLVTAKRNSSAIFTKPNLARAGWHGNWISADRIEALFQGSKSAKVAQASHPGCQFCRG
jgi:hypothetical protein